MKDRTIEYLSTLYPNSTRGWPITGKLRTLLRQIDAGIDNEQVLANNSYLNRLVTECRLFLPEMFSPEWTKNWGCQVAVMLGESWLQCELDLLRSEDKQLKIINWSGIESSPLTLARAYLLTKKLNLSPKDVSVVSLIANSLKNGSRIKFARRTFTESDFCYCDRDLRQRLSLYDSGIDLNQLQQPIAEDDNSLAIDIENMPEVALD